MGMHFIVSITGKATFRDLDASDAGIDASDMVSSEVGYGSSVEFNDAEVTGGTVTVEARASYEGYEVAAEDIEDFDGTEALESAIDSYSVSIDDVEFEVTEGPTGFDEVERAMGRSTALEVYAVLAKSWYEVN